MIKLKDLWNVLISYDRVLIESVSSDFTLIWYANDKISDLEEDLESVGYSLDTVIRFLTPWDARTLRVII